MAYKAKFLHFKTKASYEAERAKTTAGTEERKVFDAYISFIDEGPMICTWDHEFDGSKYAPVILTTDTTTSVEDYNAALNAYNSNKLPLVVIENGIVAANAMQLEPENNKIMVWASIMGAADSILISQSMTLEIAADGTKTIYASQMNTGSSTPLMAGVANCGYSTNYSREDHVHPAQTTVSGNAGTATKLQTARNINLTGNVTGSASFDGSDNISINTTVGNIDASKITSGTLSAARLPEIPIEKLPAGALERMFVVESQTAAIDAVKAGTIQEGDVVQIGNGGLMYFCIDDAATTFRNAFKEFTAGSATSVPWSGVTNAPTKLSQFTNDSGFLTSVPAASTTVTGGIKLNGNNSQYLAGDGSFYEINYNEINGTPDIATANTAGLVKPINVITKPTLNSITTTSERYYSVQMSNDGNMFVNVPWTSSSIPSDNVTGSGTSGYLAKFNGTNTITSGPKLSSSSSGLFLRDDGTWQIPFDISINGSGTIDSFSYRLNLNAGTGGISITNDEDNTYSINAVAASTSQFGTVKVGSNITVSSGTISLSKSNVTSALGYTPANTSDIPEIPIALPNPYALTINGTSYTGSSAVSINTARILSTATLSSSTVSAGYNYNNTASRTISTLSGFSANNPDSVIISSAKLTFTASNVIKMDGLDDLSGTWYIYCLSYMANSKIAVNGAVYA